MTYIGFGKPAAPHLTPWGTATYLTLGLRSSSLVCPVSYSASGSRSGSFFTIINSFDLNYTFLCRILWFGIGTTVCRATCFIHAGDILLLSVRKGPVGNEHPQNKTHVSSAHFGQGEMHLFILSQGWVWQAECERLETPLAIPLGVEGKGDTGNNMEKPGPSEHSKAQKNLLPRNASIPGQNHRFLHQQGDPHTVLGFALAPSFSVTLLGNSEPMSSFFPQPFHYNKIYLWPLSILQA